MYWIEGKSTLMKLLVRDERTRNRLINWANHPIILSHFLWTSGTKDQKSLQRLLCSLLHQLLSKIAGLVNQLMLQFSFLNQRSYADEWSKSELRQVLSRALHILDKRVCIFLDGLDEIDDEDRVEFHRFVKDLLQAQPEINLCLASRPEVPLDRIMGGEFRKPRLQDLTREDVSVTVRNFLSDFSLSGTGSNANNNEAIRDKIINLVIDRSEGVFLWVHLVLHRIHNGREAIGSLGEVPRRIEKMPTGVENLYKQTWQRHGEDEEDYRAEAADYFQLVIQWHTLPPSMSSNVEVSDEDSLSLLDVTISSNDRWRRQILHRKHTPILRLARRN